MDAEALRGLVLREQGHARDGEHGDDAEDDALGGRGRRRRGCNFDGVINGDGGRGGSRGDGEEKRSLHYW
uniref:Uncharacterized protein n=1 Tax=Arundo donax TaxID=35708 RepID=A0A0A9H9S2_ARUDO